MRAPAPAYTPTIVAAPTVPGAKLPDIPGDIRNITARIRPGEAIVDDPDALFDDMATENGIPGVDDSGMFPYGDPKGSAVTATEKTDINAGLIIAAIIAMLVLGG